MFSLQTPSSNRNRSQSNRTQTLSAPKTPGNEWWWPRPSQKTTSRNQKHTQCEVDRLISLKVSPSTYMEARDSTFMRNKWQNLEKRWIPMLSILTVKIHWGWASIRGMLLRRAEESWLSVRARCTQRISSRLWLSEPKNKKWNWPKNRETRIFWILSITPTTSNKLTPRRSWRIREINRFIQVAANSKNISKSKRYSAPFHPSKAKSYHQSNSKN